MCQEALSGLPSSGASSEQMQVVAQKISKVECANGKVTERFAPLHFQIIFIP